MNEDNKTQELFKQVRQSPTELTLQEVELMIQKIPSLPPKPINHNNWKDFLTFNNIIMGTILCAIISLFTFWGIQKESIPIVQTDHSTIETTKSEIETKTLSNLSDQETIELVIEDQPISATETNNLNSISPSPSKANMDQAIALKEQDLSFAEKSNKTSPKVISHGSHSVASAKTENTKPSSPQKEQRITTIAQPNISIDPTYPDLSGLELRRLKKKLLKNLSNDNIIKSKYDAVKIELPGGEIIVNGQTLSSSLFLKYSHLTKKAGYGSEREIQINEAFIKVGDFTADGFKGSGLGRFMEETDTEQPLSDRQLKKIEMEKELEAEEKALNLFSKKIMNHSPRTKGRAPLFSFNLHGNKTEKLFKQLHTLLAEDQLFDATNGFAFIEIAKDMIRVNGLVLDQNLHSKYDQLFADYKIKSGFRRQIRLSKHIIMVGDFIHNGFKGTSATFGGDDLNYFENN